MKKMALFGILTALCIAGCAASVGNLKPLAFENMGASASTLAIFSSSYIDPQAYSDFEFINARMQFIDENIVTLLREKNVAARLNPYDLPTNQNDAFYLEAGGKMQVDHVLVFRMIEKSDTGWAIDRIAAKMCDVAANTCADESMVTTHVEQEDMVKNLFAFALGRIGK